MGGVSTYGDIEQCAGYPRCARMVGSALRSAADELNLKWHGVVKAQGKISLPAGSEKAQIQKERLEEEGVFFLSSAINLENYAWHGSLDEDLWQQ